MNGLIEERAAEIFEAIYSLEGQRQSEALDSMVAGNIALQARVQELLSAHRMNASNRFLETPPMGSEFNVLGFISSEAQTEERSARAMPEYVGQYLIQGLIAENTFTSVYRAEQLAPVQRTAAVKVLNAPCSRRELLNRFALERQALAAMRHSNIAQFFDAGVTAEGNAFFAMEYVDGPTITALCASECLSIKARLSLFLQVCNAIEHAHRHGIIHRDLKPSNILVAKREGPHAHTVKVIDFGIAKIFSGAVASIKGTIAGQVFGTIEYMSPEQLRGDTGAVDTRTDIYALGLVLFEMLTNQSPFPASRIAGGTDRPRRAEDLPPRLGGTHRDLRGEIETVFGKATAPDPEYRYASVSELADDVQRLLTFRPIRARKQGWHYIAIKLARRHRIATVSVILLGCALFIAGLGMWRARAQRIDLAMELAEAWFSEVLHMQRTVGQSSLRGPELERLLGQVNRLATIAPDDRRVRVMTAATLTECGYVAMECGDYEQAKTMFQSALALDRLLLAKGPSERSLQQELSLALVRVGDAAGAEGDADTQRVRYVEALQLDEHLADEAVADVRSLSNLGWSYERCSSLSSTDPVGDLERTRLLWKQVAVFEKLAALATTDEVERGLSSAYLNLAYCALRSKDPHAAEYAGLAIGHGQAAVKMAPSNRYARRALIRAEIAGSNVCLAEGDASAALVGANQGVERAESLFELDPNDWDSRQLLAFALEHAAKSAVEANDLERAASLGDQARAQLDDLLSHRPGDVGLRGWRTEFDEFFGNRQGGLGIPITPSPR